MNIQNKTVLITGANRSVGRAPGKEALEPKRVHAGIRGALSVADAPPVATHSAYAMAGQGVSVHGMFRFEIPKASPEAVAQGTFDGMGNKEEDIAKAFERENANFVPGSAAV